ncbi:hypothetical protein [Flavitalea sp.]|nr:hypothetical protein [Flavitalea sp.]
MVFLIFWFSVLYSQKPKDGLYKYSIAFAEWDGKSLNATCHVRIKGDSIYIINDGSVTGTKGQIMDAGLILKHKRTGKWIIAHRPHDIDAKEVGGCGEGPSVIDFRRKRWWSC